MKIETNRAYFMPTQELEEDFLKRAEEQGFLMASGVNPTHHGGHVANQLDLCICVNERGRLVFSSMDIELDENGPESITKWKIENPEPKPTIIRIGNLKIVFNGDYTIVTDGRFTGKAKRNPADEYDAVVGLKLAVERYKESKKDYFATLSAEEIIKAISGGKLWIK